MTHCIKECLLTAVLLSVLAASTTGCFKRNRPADYDMLPHSGVDDAMTKMVDQSVEKNYDAMTLLERADTFYRKDNFIEAAPEYERFLGLYPNHRYSDYAQFKLGLSYYKQRLTIDRDPEYAGKAMIAFENVFTRYPNSSYAEPAKQRWNECRAHLARYGVYVGRFYYKQGQYSAAIARFENVTATYSDVPVAGEAFYYLALSYKKSGEEKKAKEALKNLIEKYPSDKNVEKARSLLGMEASAGS
jgi:outer membrane protein assembly factor BamD